MSEKILKALMQLFAIIANREQMTGGARGIVETFLRQQVTQAHFAYYLSFFDDYLLFLQGKASSGTAGKRLAANSVKILKICTQINSELDQKQKYIVLLKLIEFAYSFDEPPGVQEIEFIETVASVFNVEKNIADLALSFSKATNESYCPDSEHILVINSLGKTPLASAKTLLNETLTGSLVFLHIKDEGMVFVRYFGPSILLLNGQPMTEDRVHVFPQGSVIRESKMQAVYFSDVIKCFLDYSHDDDIHMTVNMVEFFFKNGHQGMHPISFTASSGNLVGIMGGSGAGKSTLLNILNGNLVPQKGEVLINGINIHTRRNELQGIIGYIPQDDLLMEELSVYQNLFYNSKLGLGNMSDEEIHVVVEELLESLGLSAIKHLKVGDPLNKTVSGGQRKRLNIALELIRKPAVLFVDEPTSGLSSLDSQNVMDLLKQLSLAGKLIFVVIHQPSSDIFKLFDKMLILDTGGYPIYYGNPSDSVIYFKRKANLAAADKSECEVCGNINPEQIFSIIESKVFDEFGQATQDRKITPVEWYEFYEEHRLPNVVYPGKTEGSGEGVYAKPSLLRQLKVFIQRDVISKLKNTQYLLINFLEAPVLAFILAYFLKYCPEGTDYIFRENLNLPAYIFMGVIVSLFMGLTVSAEEIIRDQKILKREEFLNLSRGGYLLSKILIMFTISAIQTLSFVLIGNSIFEINGMYTDYWLMLFSVSCFGNLLGLNISATFNSAVTIYILIPFLVIPQIILSGVMVKFENLNPSVTNRTKVPFIGEVMASRWAYEALAVNQYKNNKYEQYFFEYDKQLSEIVYRKDFWMVKMNDLVDSLKSGQPDTRKIELLKNELQYMSGKFTPAKPLPASFDYPLSPPSYELLKNYLGGIKKDLINSYKEVSKQKDLQVKQLNADKGKNYLGDLKESQTNDNLADMLLTTNDFEFIIENQNKFVRRFRPVYMEGTDDSFVRSQFYVSTKNVLGKKVSTWLVNLMAIWFMTLVLMIMLYRNALKRMIVFVNGLVSKIPGMKN